MLITDRRRPRCAQPMAPGFTLIELMVTITLLGILIVVSLPSFTSWTRNSQIRTVTEALQGGLRVAQSEALRRNRRVVMFFTDDDPAKNVVAVTHPATDAIPSATGKRWAVQTAPDTWGNAEYITGGTFTDVASTVSIANSLATKAICFNANGRLVDAAAGTSGTAVTGLSGASFSAALTTFDVTQATPRGDDRPLRVVLQLGGQLRMCDPKRPALSSTTPDGCPP